MLRELFEWWLSGGSRLARSLGQDREAVAIAARYRRCREAWEPHLAATRSLVLEAARACPGRDTVLVLGSGPCLDVPVAELANLFRTVVLADAHHPWPAKALARRHANVRLVVADLTGLVGPLRALGRRGTAPPDPLPRPDLALGLIPDLTASVNLASQLPIPLERLAGGRLDAAALGALGTGVVEAHFEALCRLPGRVCLCCDAAWERLAQGRVTDRRDALAGARRPPPERSWYWDIAPRPEESHSHDRRNLVHGWLDFAAAWRAVPSSRPQPRHDAQNGSAGA